VILILLCSIALLLMVVIAYFTDEGAVERAEARRRNPRNQARRVR
jgi:hypothetical protein